MFFIFQGAIWRAPFKSCSHRSGFCKARLWGLLVEALSLLAMAKTRALLRKDTTSPAGAEIPRRFAPSE